MSVDLGETRECPACGGPMEYRGSQLVWRCLDCSKVKSSGLR